MPSGPAALGHGAMLAFAAIVAGSFVLGARMANAIDPAAFTALRLGLGAAILGLVLAATAGRAALTPRRPWRFAVSGGLYAVYFVLMFEGLKTATPVSTAAVFTLTPLMSAVLGLALAGQRVPGRTALALAIGGIGALWVIFRGDLQAALALEIGRGEAIFFVGCAFYAAYPATARRLNLGESAAEFGFGTMLAGAVIVAAWSAGALRATDWTGLPAMVWITLAYTSVFASALSVVLMQTASMRLPSAKVMAYTYLTPSFVLLFDAMMGGARPPAPALWGLGLCLVSLALLLRDDAGDGAAARQL